MKLLICGGVGFKWPINFFIQDVSKGKIRKDTVPTGTIFKGEKTYVPKRCKERTMKSLKDL